jgi:hypothetical protein
MAKLMEYDHITQSTNVRDLTPEELESYAVQDIEAKEREKFRDDQAAAKTALLQRLGITEEEAALLV